ncbi:MAG: DUF935 family protein [Deinococcales bacterium]
MTKYFLLHCVLLLVACASGQTAPEALMQHTYLESTENFPNPERGFYQQFAPMWLGTSKNPLSSSQLAKARLEGVSVLRLYFLLDEFVQQDISTEALAFIEAQFLMARNAGMKLIPRFAYNFPQGGTYPYNDPDASLSRVLAHIAQLEPTLQQNADLIAFLELGFVGAWGEWHSSTNNLVDYTPEGKGANPEYRNEVARRLKEMGANRSIALPPGFDVKLLEATANTWGTFKAQIDMADSGMAIAILGQNLTSKVKEGSLAAANIHQEVRTDIIISDGRALDTTLHKQQWVWWAEFNFGDKKLTPWAEFDTTPPTDLTEQAETMNKVADAVVKLEGKGADVKKILERFGIPMLDETPATSSSQLLANRLNGFVRGQMNTDLLSQTALRDHLALHKDEFETMYNIILAGGDYETLTTNAIAAFEGMDTEKLAQRLEQTLILAELLGRWAVDEDVQ